jgi:hypothetical protein
MNYEFLFESKIIKAHDPVDMNTAAITGARIKADGCERIAVVCQMGTSTAATVQFTLKQHNAASAGTSKVLPVLNSYYVKAGAATVFTKTEPTVAQSLFDVSTDFAANAGYLVLEVLPEDLDVNNGFAWMSVDIADSAAAKLAATSYIKYDCEQKPAYEVA